MGSRFKGDTRERPQPICRPRQSPSSPIAIAGPAYTHTRARVHAHTLAHTDTHTDTRLRTQTHTHRQTHTYTHNAFTSSDRLSQSFSREQASKGERDRERLSCLIVTRLCRRLMSDERLIRSGCFS